MINGVARYGIAGADGRARRRRRRRCSVGGKKRRLFLEQETGDPDVASVSLSAARSALRAAFRDLPKLARELEKPKPEKASAGRARRAASRWSGRSRSTRFKPPGSTSARGCRSTARATSPGPSASRQRAAAAPLSTILEPDRAGPSHRGRRSRFPAEDREAAQRARPCSHRPGAALLSTPRTLAPGVEARLVEAAVVGTEEDRDGEVTDSVSGLDADASGGRWRAISDPSWQFDAIIARSRGESLAATRRRDGRACPGHQSWHCAATDGRDKPGHDGKGWFHAGRRVGDCRPVWNSQ